MKLKDLLIICLLITVHWLLLVNLRFEAWPEMLVYPYLLNHGFKLYQDIINPYPPLFTYFLAVFSKIFAITVFNLKLLTWAIILLSDVLIYLIALKRYGKTPALIALTFFIIFQPLLDGNGLWYDLALTPVLLLAFHLNSPWLLAGGFFIKQSVIWLFPLFIKQWRRIILSVLSLFLVSCFLFLVQGNLQHYLFWPWRFALTILPTMPGHKDWGSPTLWLIGLLPFLPLIWIKKSPPFYWAILSFLFIFPRFGLFHLQPALAFAALTLATSLQGVKLKKYLLPATCYLLLASLIWFRQIKLYWHQPTRFFEPEILKAAEQLKARTSASQPILFLNAPDQLMVLADRLPPKPWAITFPWYLELPGMQQRFIDAIKAQRPQAVLFSPYQNQGRFTPGSYRPAQLDDFVQSEFAQTTQISDSLYLKLR